MELIKAETKYLWKLVCFKSDLKAFEKLFYITNAKLVKFCMFYVRQREVAEEIVSDVFVRCWEGRSKLTEIDNPETYLFVAVKNRSLNYQKKYSSIHLIQLDESNEIGFINTYDPQKEMERKELHFQMDQAIAALPPQACLVFKLIKEDGMKYKEVAEILNISTRTVQTQLFRAMKKLCDLLSAHHPKTKPAFKPSLPDFTLLLILFNFFFI